jgi:GNAT superfamily N-acetyltransferase
MTDTEDFGLRPATENDSDFAFSCMKSAFGGYVAQTYGWDEDEQLKLHQRRFRPSDTKIVLRYGIEIGLLAVDDHEDHIHVRQVFLLPEAQGLGIGSMPVKEILEDADRRGLPVKLRVLKVNPRALRFYERLGFHALSETETHFQMEYERRAIDA